MRPLATLIVLCGLCGPLLGAQAQVPSTQPSKPDYRRYPNGYKPSVGGAYVGLSLPVAIQDEEWQRYCDVLVLSAEQRKLFDEMYEKYRQDDWDFRLRETQPLWDRSAAVNAKQDVGKNVESAAAFTALLKECDRVLPHIASRDDRFFNSLVPLLAEEQLARLQRVRDMRTRTRCNAQPSMFPASMLDLEVSLLRLRVRNFDMTPRDPSAFDDLMAAYSTAITPMFANRCETQSRQLGAINMLSAKQQSLPDPKGKSAAEGIALRDRVYTMRRPIVALAKRIHDTNRQYVELFAEQLPPETAESLRNDFYLSTYKALYPEPFDIHEFLANVDKIKGLNEEQSKQINEVKSLYKSTFETVHRQMIDLYLDWHEMVAIRGYGIDALDDYTARMRAFRKQFEMNAELVMKTLREQLSPEQLAPIEPLIKSYEQDAKAFHTKQEMGKAWPGPWD